jgi:hypothetical protein
MYIDIIGKKFGKLKVIEKYGIKQGYISWKCQCNCGKVIIVRGDSLRSGNSTSCDCWHKIQNIDCGKVERGYGKHILVYTYRDMMRRCYFKNDKIYHRYGGRGIKVCNLWKNSFISWLKDIGTKPGLNYTLDRIDNNGNYEPGNVKWSTYKEKRINSTSIKLTQNDVDEIRKIYSEGLILQKELAKKYNISQSRISQIITNRGWKI